MFLSPGGLRQLLPQLRIPRDHKAPLLPIAGRGCQSPGLEDPIHDLVGYLPVLKRPHTLPRGNGFIHVHRAPPPFFGTAEDITEGRNDPIARGAGADVESSAEPRNRAWRPRGA